MVARPASSPRALAWQAGTLGLIGAAPDLDLLIGRHSAETHSVGAAALVATVAAVTRWPVDPSRMRIWLAVFLAWSSHPLLDALSPDTKPPIGVMAFWPFTRDYFNTGLPVFLPISRTCCTMQMVLENTWAMVRETLTLGPVLGGVWWIRSRASGPGRRDLPRYDLAD